MREVLRGERGWEREIPGTVALLGQEGDGLVLLVPGVQAGRVFSGHSAGHIGSRIIAESVRLVLPLAS